MIQAFQEFAALEETILNCRDSILVGGQVNPLDVSMAEYETMDGVKRRELGSAVLD